MPFGKKNVIVGSVVNVIASFKSQLDTLEEQKKKKRFKVWLSELINQAAFAFVEDFKIMPFHILTAAK